MSKTSLFDLPVKHGAREQAFRLVRRVDEACLRLGDPDDLEALHDFRVGLRRLRTFGSAFAEHLPFGRKLRRGLRKLARGTNGPRDAEVGLAWLGELQEGFDARRRIGLNWLVERLEREKETAYARLTEELPQRWLRQQARLRRKLTSPFSDELDAATFGQAGGRRIQAAADALENQLARVEAIEHEDAAHRARILGKRLRYLLEPFKGTTKDVSDALKQLKSFQDLLGRFNDAQVMLTRLRSAAEQASAERAGRLFDLGLEESADPRLLRALRQRSELPGLLEIARRAHELRLQLFAEVSQHYLDGRAAPLLARARAAADHLVQGGRRPALRVVAGETSSDGAES